MNLDGKTVLVTGASQGIGAAFAGLAAARGARVVLVARTAPALEEVVAAIRRRGDEAHHYPGDVTDAGWVRWLARMVAGEVGVPEVVVNNAGAGRWLGVEETAPEEFVELLGVPYLGACYVTRAFIEDMLARGSGQVVNINSAASRVAWPGSVGYTAARFALRGFSEALRADLHGTGITVTEFVASKVTSNYFANNPGAEERIPRIQRLIPTLTPEQAAKALLRAIEHDAQVAYAPFAYRLLASQANLAPRLSSWLTVKTGATRDRRTPAPPREGVL